MDENQMLDVVEMSPIVDSVIVCKEFYGTEKRIHGYYTSFHDFSKKADHSFFKTRNRSDAGEAYNTQTARDTATEPFQAFSIGVAFIAPSNIGFGQVEIEPEGPPIGEQELAAKPASKSKSKSSSPGLKNFVDPPQLGIEESPLAHWWRTELPNECSLIFKTGQDVRLEVNCLGAPPGYGLIGGGVDVSQAGRPLQDLVFGVNAVTQGTPVLTNRFQFEKFIDIAKNMQMEAIIQLSEPAREYLQDGWGPGDLVLPKALGHIDLYPARYLIQVSLLGVRYVSKRGEARK
jgi:hypothetical protein